jgi:hypothetical protein
VRLLDRQTMRQVARGLAAQIMPCAGAGALALAVMYLAWPWAQQNPISGPIESFNEFSRFPISLDYPFFGRIINSLSVPWYYEAGTMAAMLPELVVGAAAVALLLGVAAQWRARRGRRTCGLPYLALALMIVFPPAYAAVERTVLFDGMRHMLFVVPPLTVAAALAIDLMWASHDLGRALAAGLVAVTAVNQASLLWRSHPYEYLVFNAFVGGVPGAAGRFELDYWGLAFREAVEQMRARLEREGAQPPPGRPWRVSICGPEASAELFFPPQFVRWPRDQIADADFHITNTRYQCPRGIYLTTAPELAVVRRFEVPLAYAYDLRGHNTLPYLPNPQSP